ncbi:MAG: beta-ketoacyl synthase chain length factor [Rickettsiales bacterium]
MSVLPITITAWSASAPGITTTEEWQQWCQQETPINDDGSAPSTQAIPAILRRRLNRLGKRALGVAMPLLAEQGDIPCVLSSRHGDLQRTVTLLRDLAEEDTIALSPTHFSLSVHNAIGGLLSIIRKDTANITALSSGQAGLGNAFLEAAMLLAETEAEQVLCMIYDDPVPPPYDQDATIAPHYPYAAAFMLSNQSDETATHLTLQRSSDELIAGQQQHPEAILFIQWLLRQSPTPLSLVDRTASWQFSRR